MSQQPTTDLIDSLQKCAVNSFSCDEGYLRNCCTGREPYISEYIQKRCNELYQFSHNTPINTENSVSAIPSSEISVYYKE